MSMHIDELYTNTHQKASFKKKIAHKCKGTCTCGSIVFEPYKIVNCIIGSKCTNNLASAFEAVEILCIYYSIMTKVPTAFRLQFPVIYLL